MSAGALRPLLNEHLNVGDVGKRIVFRKNLSPNVDARTAGLFFEQEIENNATAFINQVTIAECSTAQLGYRLRPGIENKRSNDVCHNCSPNSFFLTKAPKPAQKYGWLRQSRKADATR